MAGNKQQQSNSEGRQTKDARKRRHPSYDCFRSFVSGTWRVISMEFLRWFISRHLAGKPVTASRNVGDDCQVNTYYRTQTKNEYWNVHFDRNFSTARLSKTLSRDWANCFPDQFCYLLASSATAFPETVPLFDQKNPKPENENKIKFEPDCF